LQASHRTEITELESNHATRVRELETSHNKVHSQLRVEISENESSHA